MKMRQLSRGLEVFGTFAFVSLVVMAYEGLRRLHALGQNVTGILVDSLGAAAIFTLFMYVFRYKDQIERYMDKN